MSPSRAKKKWPKSERFCKFLKPTGTQGTEQRLWSYLDHQTLVWRKEKNIFAFEGEGRGGARGAFFFSSPCLFPFGGIKEKGYANSTPMLTGKEERNSPKKGLFQKYAQFVGVLVKDIPRYGFPLMIPPWSLLLLLPPGRKEEEGREGKKTQYRHVPPLLLLYIHPKKEIFFLRVKKEEGNRVESRGKLLCSEERRRRRRRRVPYFLISSPNKGGVDKEGNGPRNSWLFGRRKMGLPCAKAI